MKTTLLVVLLLALACSLSAQVTACSQYSYTGYLDWGSVGPPGSPGSVQGFVDHTSGGHSLFMEFQGDCDYSGDGLHPTCSIVSNSSLDGGTITYDTGGLNSSLVYHDVSLGSNPGAGQSNGAQLSTQVTGAGTANECYKHLGCNVTIGFSGSASGVGASVSFGPNNLKFQMAQALLTVCSAEADPQFERCPVRAPCHSTPIIVDTTGKGFHLTSAENGVTFDIHANGKPIKVAWTAPGSGNAFLALDRDHNGVIENGNELFGNVTPQPQSNEENGYLALAEFDKPANGGNGDGIIDKRDWVFSHLLLCIDDAHTGILIVGQECKPLEKLGVYSIGLSYQEERLTDQFGNVFRYRGVLNPDPADGTSRDGRYTYDVFLATPQPKQQQTAKSIEAVDKKLR